MNQVLLEEMRFKDDRIFFNVTEAECIEAFGKIRGHPGVFFKMCRINRS